MESFLSAICLAASCRLLPRRLYTTIWVTFFCGAPCSHRGTTSRRVIMRRATIDRCTGNFGYTMIRWNEVMTVWIRSHRRPVARLLACALAMLATSAGAAWRCLDGTLCPPGHFASSASPQRTAAPGGSERACCRGRGQAAPLCASTGRSKQSLAPSTAQCILSGQSAPDARLQAQPVLTSAEYTGLWILLPAPLRCALPEAPAQSALSPPRLKPSQGLLAPLSSRAPPMLLA